MFLPRRQPFDISLFIMPHRHVKGLYGQTWLMQESNRGCGRDGKCVFCDTLSPFPHPAAGSWKDGMFSRTLICRQLQSHGRVAASCVRIAASILHVSCIAYVFPFHHAPSLLITTPTVLMRITMSSQRFQFLTYQESRAIR